MKEERITQIYDYLNSSSDKEWIDPYYEHVSFDLLVMIVDYIENQQENEITINNALIKLLHFCEKNKDKSGYEIYKEIVFKNKLSKRKTTSFIALTSSALKYVSENGMNDGYSYLKSIITSTLADKDLNIVNSNIGMSQKTVTPYIKDGAITIVDSKGYLNREDLEAKGYEVKMVSLEKDKFSLFDPYKALQELAEEDPIKFKRVVNELEGIIKNVTKEN